MAKVELSALLVSLTGKLSGSVFQNSLGGLQLRSRVSPRNPRSAKQQSFRSKWGSNARLWNTLLPAEIASWNDNAPEGSSGKAFFQEINAFIIRTGQPALRTYSPGSALDAPGPVFDAIEPGNLQVSFPGIVGALPAATYLNYFLSPQYSPGTSFISSHAYIFLGSILPAAEPADTIDITAAYTAAFGNPVPGNVIGIRAYQIDVSTGQTSPADVNQAYVEAP